MHIQRFTSFILIMTSSFLLELGAQQQLVSNQNIWLLASSNPAAIETEPGTNVQALFRRNWTKAEQSPTQVFCRLESGSSKQAADIKLQQYKNQFYERTEIKAGYKYRLQIDEHQFFSVGLRFGFLQSRYNFSSLKAQHPDETILQTNAQQNFSAIADFGVLYTIKNLKASLSIQNYSPQNQLYLQNALRELPHFSALLAYTIRLSEFEFSPVVQTGSSLGLPLITDVSIVAERKQKFGLQFGFKSNRVAHASFRYFANNHLAVAIGIDYPFALSTYMGYGNEMAMYYFSK